MTGVSVERRCELARCNKVLVRRKTEAIAPFLRRKFCSNSCATAARIKSPEEHVQRRRRYQDEYAREHLSAEKPVVEPWTPRERVVLVTDEEQRQIDRAADVIIRQRMDTPLTAEIARRMGIAV